jgi:hypothetical protein
MAVDRFGRQKQFLLASIVTFLATLGTLITTDYLFLILSITLQGYFNFIKSSHGFLLMKELFPSSWGWLMMAAFCANGAV